jgi:hypothetical protein
MRIHGWGTAVAACAVALAGCSGGGGQPKAEVVAEANTICNQFEREEARIEKRPPKTPDDLVRALGELQPVATRFVEQLDALDPAGADAEYFDRFIEISRTQVGLLGEMQDAVTVGDRARFQAANDKLDQLNVRSDIAAQQYGMNDCVSASWKQTS